MMMRATGIVRKIDDLGRVVIPKELRNTFGYETNQDLEIYVEGGNIVIRMRLSECTFCGASDELVAFDSKFVCSNCVTHIHAMAT